MTTITYVPSGVGEGYFTDWQAPTASDDGKPWAYNHSTGNYEPVAAVVPGGSTTQVQYNSSGSFAGHSGFTYDGSGTATLSTAMVVPVIRPESDSTTAVVVQNAAGSTDVLTVDTTNGRLASNGQGIAYVPGGNFTGTIYFGGGGSSISHTSGNDGKDNTAVGVEALHSSTSGYRNTAVGYRALYSNTSGLQNTAVGTTALFSTTTGNQNTAMGYRALYSTTTGYQNNAIGGYVLNANTTGYQNNAMGYFTLNANTTGYQNNAIAVYALRFNTTGYQNNAMGYGALNSNTTGYQNTAFGAYALFSTTTGNQNTALGYQAGYNETGSNKLYIANSDTATPLVYGEFDNGILKFHSTVNSDAVTDTVSLVKLRSSGTPGTGLGVALRAGLHSTTTADQDAGRLTWEWVTATHASRASRGKLTAYSTSSEQEAIAWDGDSGGVKLGFFGATPVAQSAAYTVTNGSADRSYDANSTTLDEVADVLGTLIGDLQAVGLIG